MEESDLTSTSVSPSQQAIYPVPVRNSRLGLMEMLTGDIFNPDPTVDKARSMHTWKKNFFSVLTFIESPQPAQFLFQDNNVSLGSCSPQFNSIHNHTDSVSIF